MSSSKKLTFNVESNGTKTSRLYKTYHRARRNFKMAVQNLDFVFASNLVTETNCRNERNISLFARETSEMDISLSARQLQITVEDVLDIASVPAEQCNVPLIGTVVLRYVARLRARKERDFDCSQ